MKVVIYFNKEKTSKMVVESSKPFENPLDLVKQYAKRFHSFRVVESMCLSKESVLSEKFNQVK